MSCSDKLSSCLEFLSALSSSLWFHSTLQDIVFKLLISPQYRCWFVTINFYPPHGDIDSGLSTLNLKPNCYGCVFYFLWGVIKPAVVQLNGPQGLYICSGLLWNFLSPETSVIHQIIRLICCRYIFLHYIK